MRIFLAFIFLSIVVSIQAQDQKSRIIFIGAHPDDCDQDGGGTAILLSQLGHAVKFVSVTNGDAGHQTEGGGALGKRRRAEAMEAGKRFGVEYKVLDNHDGELVPSLDVRLQIIREIRKWEADIVIAPRPNDYHPDHRYTGVLVQDAAYMVGVPNVAPDTPPLGKNPVFLYTQDFFDRPNPFRPDVVIDISSVYDKKVYALSAHRSQFFEWLPWIGGYEDQVPATEEGKLDWLTETRRIPITADVRKSLVKWYGERGNTIEHAESFEICEYGRQPSEEELKTLIPMLSN